MDSAMARRVSVTTTGEKAESTTTEKGVENRPVAPAVAERVRCFAYWLSVVAIVDLLSALSLVYAYYLAARVGFALPGATLFATPTCWGKPGEHFRTLTASSLQIGCTNDSVAVWVLVAVFTLGLIGVAWFSFRLPVARYWTNYGIGLFSALVYVGFAHHLVTCLHERRPVRQWSRRAEKMFYFATFLMLWPSLSYYENLQQLGVLNLWDERVLVKPTATTASAAAATTTDTTAAPEATGAPTTAAAPEQQEAASEQEQSAEAQPAAGGTAAAPRWVVVYMPTWPHALAQMHMIMLVVVHFLTLFFWWRVRPDRLGYRSRGSRYQQKQQQQATGAETRRSRASQQALLRDRMPPQPQKEEEGEEWVQCADDDSASSDGGEDVYEAVEEGRASQARRSGRPQGRHSSSALRNNLNHLTNNNNNNSHNDRSPTTRRPRGRVSFSGIVESRPVFVPQHDGEHMPTVVQGVPVVEAVDALPPAPASRRAPDSPRPAPARADFLLG